MLKRVILTTDFSPNSQRAADFVITYFKQAKIYLFHAFSAPQVGKSVLISIDDILENDAREAMNRELKRIQLAFPYHNNSIEPIIANQEFSTSLKELILNRESEIVIMGTKGAGGIQGKLFGSNASKMIGKTRVPLLLIPENFVDYAGNGLEKFVLATDLKEVTDLPFLAKFISELNNGLTSHADILFVDQGDSKIDNLNRVALLNSMKEFNPVFHRLHGDHYAHTIEDFIHVNGHELLVMVHRNHSFFDRLFKSSVSKNLAMSVDIPTLVLSD